MTMLAELWRQIMQLAAKAAALWLYGSQNLGTAPCCRIGTARRCSHFLQPKTALLVPAFGLRPGLKRKAPSTLGCNLQEALSDTFQEQSH